MSEEPRYSVVSPAARRASRTITPAARSPDLRGKKVAELWDLMFRGETVYPAIREYLSQRYPGITFVDHTRFGNIHGAAQVKLVADLPRLLAEEGCDAVIAGIGA